MLKSRKNVRKIIDILIITIMILGLYAINVASVDIGNGSITPIYKPKWRKVSSSITGETISVVLEGKAQESQDIDDNTKINYSSNVTTALTTDDILVYINGELDGDTNGNGILDKSEDVNTNGVLDEGEDKNENNQLDTYSETPSITKTLSLPSPSATDEVITQTLTLSNFVESARQPDKPYKEWSGNISIKILGRGKAADTYDADVLIDVYGNQNMMELDDESGVWNDIIFKDEDSTTNINTSGTMFTDFVKPELTYKYANTVIDHNTKKVTIVFDVVDKYFKQVTSTFIKDNLTVKISDYDDATVQSKISKVLQLKEIASETTDAATGATYKTNGDIYFDVNNDGTQERIGQRYELIISELEQNPNDGFDFSGYMNIAFPADIIEDLSGNKNNAKTICVGIDEPTNSMTFPYLPTNYSYVEGDVDTGLVIQDPLGNQYVWVEVPRNTTVYSVETLELDLDNLSGSALEDAYDAIESDLHTYTSTYRNGTENTDIWWTEGQGGLTETAYYELKNKMLKSVFENGGFYVGRYETGIADSEPDVIDTTAEARTDKTQAIEDYTPVIQANAYPYNYVTNSQAQTLASSFASSGYTSSLLFGVQWELVLKYIETKATNQDTIVSELISDSGSWGNYVNYPRDITNTSAKYSADEGITWSDDAVGQRSSGKLLSTGAISDYSKQKIYDLAGNVGEYTLEHIPGTTGSPCVTRSGSFWSYGNGSPANSRGAAAHILSNGMTGFRVALFENEGTESELIGNQGVVVDVVDPVWKVENKQVTTTTVDGQPVTSASMDFIVVDKYFKESTLELDDIQILVEGVDINQVDEEGNLIIAPELERSLSEPVYIKWDHETGTYEDENVTEAEANGQKYTFTLSNLEESDELFFGERAKYNTDPETGRVYREYSGPGTVVIPKGIATDQYGNDSEKFEVPLGNIDTLKPEVIKVSSTYNTNEENVELSTHTIVFDIVDKYFDTAAISTTNTSKIHVYLDGELTEIDTNGDGVVDTDTVKKTITDIKQLDAMVGGTSQKVGYRYTLVLSNFQNPRTSINYDREYTDWSGVLTVKIDANTAYDKNGLANEETILAGNEINTSTLANADFVDYIKPDATYQYLTSDIDYSNKKFTMKFDVTDKFYTEDLSLTDLQILVSAENETEEGEDGYYDLMANDKIGKSLISEDITNTVNGTPKVIGKRYTLVLSNLEQLQRIEGNYYLDYSGSITIIIPEGSVKDNGPKGDGNDKNGNDVTSIVSGINIPGGEISDIETIDVVHPLWERESFTTDIHNKTATITVLGTDKDFWEDEDEDTVADTDKYGTLTTDEIKLFIDGVESSGNITLNEPTKLYEERIVKEEYGDGSLTGELTTETVQYGIRYTITITNLPIDKKQVKIQLIEGSLVDKSDNLSRSTEFLVYNTLIATNTETAETSKFLNEIVPEGRTAIARQDIEKVVFVNSTAASTAETVQNVWDASAQRDNSILAWYSEETAPYTVYIGSNDDIYGNVDSSYLFSYIGYGESCVNTQVIDGLNLLHTENVTDMSYMFQYFGYKQIVTFDLGTNFDTKNVTDMSHMFESTGFTVMTTLDLGDKFDTSKVTTMGGMFKNCGQAAFQTIIFGNQFNTSEVLNMSSMFEGLGKDSTTFTTLDLSVSGLTFNTSKVTNMSLMFKECGQNSISTFCLGNNFNTQEVINMSEMFKDFGYALETLTLGEKFNTNNVTSMGQMFVDCGVTNLELGDNFDTSNVSGNGMYRMFMGFGNSETEELNLGNKFDTSKITDMGWMFGYCNANTIDLGDKFYTTSAQNVGYMFGDCTADIIDLGAAFTRIPENNSGFMYGEPVIYASESIYSDMTHFKLSTDSPTTISIEDRHSRVGTIIPIYKPTWEKVSTTIDTSAKTITVVIKGKANETFTNGDYTGTYSSDIKSYLPTGNELTLAQEKLLNIYIDDELDGDLDGNGIIEGTEDPTIKRKVVKNSETATEVQYTITLSGFEQTTRQVGKNFTEWAGNIAIQPVKGTLVDKYGSYIGTQTVTNEDGSTSEVQVPVTAVFEDASGNKIGNQNMASIDDASGKWNNIQLEEETPTDRNTAETMFTDYIKPEFTYEYYNTEIEGDTGANTVIDYTNNKVTVVFDVTDKYFKEVTTDFISDNMTVRVDNDADANTQIQKALTKTGIFVMNKTTKEVTLKAATYTPTTAEQKVGERYQLVLTNIESEVGVGYSGVVSLSFPAGIVTDLSGNASDATSITIGIDKPTNPDHDGDDGEPDHDTGVVVDVVDPVWSYVTSDIDRTNNQVNIYILGSDKFYKENTLTKDNITVYVDNSSTTVDTDRDGSPDANVSNITKTLTPITDATELANMAATIGLTDDITDNLTKASVGYKLTLSTFGTISGQTKVVLPAGTIEDTSGNTNKDPKTINVGNINWVEDNEPLEDGDEGYPRYPAFRNHIVDFIKPIITYTYSTTEGTENPDVDYEYKTVTVKFTVTDKYLLESALIDTDNKPKNLSILVDGTTVFDKATNVALVDATISSTDIANGKEYTLIVSNIEQNPNDGFNYSGTMQLVFAAGAIEDTSGNVNNVKTITLDTEIDTDIVDVVDPIIMLTEVDGLKLSYVNGANTINRTDNTDTVTIKIRATDKYLSTGSLGTEENKARIKVKTVKYDGTVIENSATVASVVKGTQTGGSNPYVEYTITLSDFGSNDEGVVSITIPDGVITDTSGNTNLETTFYVGNATWEEPEGTQYTAFNNSIVDFTDPIWEYATSSITRDRTGQTGTVTVKILGKDNYYHSDSLTKEIIEVYVNDTLNETIEKDLVKITDAAELNGYSTGYILTLSNFGTNDGITKIKIPAGSIRDTSGNGNLEKEIPVGNEDWIETDVEETPVDPDNPKYTAFRDSIVDFIKPVITYQYQEGVNPKLDRTNNAENVKLTFNVTDTNFLESNIGIEDIQVFIDVGANEQEITTLLRDRNAISISSAAITNGIAHTLTLSKFELDNILTGEIFKRHSGVIKLVIAANQVEDTSGNKNNQTTLIIDNDNGDDSANGIIVDFVDPIIYYHDKYINWDKRYAEITLRATDRFYDENTKLDPADITLYELNLNDEWIQITDFENKITITPVENDYGYDFVIKLSDFEEEFKMKVSIPAGKLGDTSGNTNQFTEIEVILDNKKPRWQYVSTVTSEFESTGVISFNVKGVDKFLRLEDSGLEVGDIKILQDGVDITNVDNITLSAATDNTTEKSKSYTINVSGLTTAGKTYTLLIAENTLIDEFNNTSAATTINFSKSAISSNTDNYTNITYHASYDKEHIHSSFVHELMSVNTTGTNAGTSTFRPSTLGELNNDGKNPLFAEPFKYDETTQIQTASYFAGWAEASEKGFETAGGTTYGLYDEIPNTVVNLKAVWGAARVIFVSDTEGDNSYDGLSPDTAVADIETAYSKLNSSGTAESNIIVIMDAVEWNSATVLDKNATITSLYAGIDYRASNNAELKVSSNMQTTADIIFDNIKLYSSSDSIALIANYNDITLGRKITTSSGYTFGSVIGGNYQTESNTGELGEHTVRVEAGKYNKIIAGSTITTPTTTSKLITHNVVIGNMRDTAVSRNDKLTITGYVVAGENELRCYPSGANGAVDAYEKQYLTMTLYSGTFTSTDVAIYGRSLGGQNDGKVTFDMYGGNITGDVYAGPAYTTTSHSNEVVNTMNFYGGEITGDVYGQGKNADFTGSSTINLAGRIKITGNVYGGSYSNTDGSGDGRGNIVINVSTVSATVTENIFGGGNGSSGRAYITGNTTITVDAGTLKNIYGSGNGSGNSGSTNIIINNGSISGNVVGGAKDSQVETDTNITVVGGTIGGNIYGGNENSSSMLDSDTILQNGNITIGSTDATITTKPTITGYIYGAGTYDKVGTTTINLIKSENALKVFGGSNANSETTTANIYLQGATASVIYGGGHSAGTVTTANINLESGSATDVYGGGYAADVNRAYIELGKIIDYDTYESTGTATIGTIFGGPNTSGKVETSSIHLQSGNLTNVYGGGNSAEVRETNVFLKGITIDTIHGGSKDSGRPQQSAVGLVIGTVNNVFGGGLDVGSDVTIVLQAGATVKNIYGGNNSTAGGTGGETGTSNIEIMSGEVENIYGGNYLKGTTKNSYITIHGDSTVTGKLYGGGYKSNIGKSSELGSTSINIAKGTIQGDINGGSEEGIVYGNTNINIGFEVIDTNARTLDPVTTDTAGEITILGNIYGAGSSNLAINRDTAETPTEYNYDYVSVVGNTFITMDNSTDSPIAFTKSIYGAGNGATYNNGTVNDGSTIKIRDLGSSTNSHVMTSIERTGRLYISNSFVELLGKQDVNNQYKKTSYTLNRIIRTLTLAENSTLYTRRGFNMVGGFNSYNSVTEYGTGTKTTVTITDGVATATANNRIYTFEGVNLIFAKEEAPLPTSTNFGDVNGMAFFGMYALDNSGNKEYDIYAPNYTSGAVEGYFGAGTYIEGKHKTNHDISKDGFYTNVAEFSGGTATVTAEIIQPTPANATYYDWIIGAETITYDVSLIGSIFGDESMEELVLDFNYAPGATYTFDRVSLNALDLGVKLVDPTTIPIVADNENVTNNANNTFGLSIETGTTGWTSQASTNVYTTKAATDTTGQDNGAFVGDKTYKTDTSTTPGAIRFKMHSSLNITEDKDLGYVNLILTGKTTTGEDPSVGNTFIIVIAVNLQTEAVPQIEDYVPRFTDTAEKELHFTSDSKVDITYLLFKDMASNPYASGDYRVLSTTMPLPAGTKITLKDHGIGNSPKVYYSHITASTAYTEETLNAGTADEEIRYIYRLSDFFEMDSTTAKYQDSSSYYHSEGYVLEKYDLSIDFIDAGIDTNKLEQETYLELRDSAGANKYNNGDTEITYNLYATTVDDEGNTISANAVMVETINEEVAGKQYSVIENTEVTFTLTASITEQKTADGKTIKDTKYYDKISGIAIEVLDKSEERVKSPDAQNIKIVDLATSTEYVADESGIIRVPLLAGISSITKEYTFSITQQSVEPGRGSANIYFFASDDGKYYGEEPKLEQNFYLMFVNKVLGAIGIDATNDSRIINSSTGKNLSGNSGIDMTVNVGDAVEETNIRVELYKRNATYDADGNYTGTVYTAVDLNSYIQEDLDTPATHGYTAGTTYEYFFWEYEAPEEPEGGEPTPQTNTITAIEFEKLLETSVTTGEYKLVFKSYYENTLVQTVRKTFIVTE